MDAEWGKSEIVEDVQRENPPACAVSPSARETLGDAALIEDLDRPARAARPRPRPRPAPGSAAAPAPPRRPAPSASSAASINPVGPPPAITTEMLRHPHPPAVESPFCGRAVVWGTGGPCYKGHMRYKLGCGKGRGSPCFLLRRRRPAPCGCCAAGLRRATARRNLGCGDAENRRSPIRPRTTRAGTRDVIAKAGLAENGPGGAGRW